MRRYVSRLYGNGATIVPKEVREVLDLDLGDLIVWIVDEKRRVVTVTVEKDVLDRVSREVSIKGRWTGKIFTEYVSMKVSKK